MAVKNILFKIGADIKNIDSQLKTVTDDLGKLNKAVEDVNQNFKSLTSNASKGLNNVSSSAKNATSNISSFANILKGGLAIVGITSAVEALKEFTLEAVRSAAEFQKNQIAFKTFIGSAEQANKVLKDLVQLAVKTPFTSEETIAASRVLAAYGFNANQLISIVGRLGNIASGTQIPLQQLALVFGQIKAAGKLMGQDLLQLVNAGFNPLQEISERTGESMANLRIRMGEGKISFDEVAQSIYYATERGGRFYNLNEKLSQTTAGRLDALREKWQLFTREVGIGFESYTSAFVDFGNVVIKAAEGIVKFDMALLKLIGSLPAVQLAFKAINFIVKQTGDAATYAADKINSAVDAANKLRGITPAAPLPSAIIPKEEETKQLTVLEERNKKLKETVSLARNSWKEGKFDLNQIQQINNKLDAGHKIRLKNINDQRDFNAELAAAYDQLLKQNDLESKGDMYKAIKKRANEQITYFENVRKGIQEAYNARPFNQKTSAAYLKMMMQVGNINAEIERLKSLIWDADAKDLAVILQQGTGHGKVKDQIQKIVDLYVQLRKTAQEVEDIRVGEFKGNDEATQRLRAEMKYSIDSRRIEESRADRIKELQKERLSELQSTNKDAVLSAKDNAEIMMIVDGELRNRQRVAESNFNKDILAIDDKFNAERRKAAEDSRKLDYKNEEEYYTDRIKLYDEFIKDTQKAAQEAKTGRQFRTQIGFLNQTVEEQNRNIANQRNAKIEQLNIEEDAAALQANLAGASKEKLDQIEKDFADKRVAVVKAADDAIAKNTDDNTQFIIDQQKIRRDAIIQGWSQVIGEIKNASQVVTDEIIRQTEVLITEQEKRVEKAKAIADKGNAEFLQREEDRLNKLNEKRRKAARVANAIAKSEAIAQASLAVAKAAGETGPGAPFAIASTLIALAAGLAAAYTSIKSDNFYKGGYTGDGGKYEAAGTVHKGEFVFTKEKTQKYRSLFEDIHAGRNPNLIQGFGDKVIVVNNNMNDRLERIEKAILNQNRMQLSIDERGIHGIVSRVDFNNRRFNNRF